MKLTSILVAALVGKSLASDPFNLRPDRRPPVDLSSVPTCTEFSFPVTVSAANVVLPLTKALVFQEVSGTYNIYARYCEPQHVVKSRQNTLQILVHGITYDRNYWSGEGNPDGATISLGASYNGTTYSWVDYASQQGFPTLSIDRLGNGLSERPDPVNVLQTPLQVEVNHQIIAMARAGALPLPQPRKFNKIVYIGHSYGSVLGNALNMKYPNDVEGTILTGLNKVYNGAFIDKLAAGLLPASVVNSRSWSALNTGYLAIVNQSLFEQAYYYPGHFDQGLIDVDFARRGTVGVGELDSALAFGPVVAAGYKNPILDITGQHDQLMCFGPNPDQTAGSWITYDCGSGQSANLVETGTLYPNADYDYYAPSLSGHCLNFHLSAQSTFAYAHTWLTSRHF